VLAAEFGASNDEWTIYCDGGTTIRVSLLIAAIGFAAKHHFPDGRGLKRHCPSFLLLAKPRNPPDKTQLDEKREFLSPAFQSLRECGAEVITNP
jgi:hypothetical protein